MVVCVLIIWSGGIANAAVQPDATVTKRQGNVFRIVQGNPPTEAQIGTRLQLGDKVQTKVYSNATVTFSDESFLNIEENSELFISALTATDSGARKSKIMLLAGVIQADISIQHQTPGSAFSVETPNCMADVKFSHPRIKFGYDPVLQMTSILAFTTDVIVIDLSTHETATTSAGYYGVISREGITIMPIQPSQIIDPRFMNWTRELFRRTTSPAPSTVQPGTGISKSIRSVFNFLDRGAFELHGKVD